MLKSLLMSPNTQATIGAVKGPVVTLFSPTTTSGTKTVSSFLNFRVYSSNISCVHSSAGELCCYVAIVVAGFAWGVGFYLEDSFSCGSGSNAVNCLATNREVEDVEVGHDIMLRSLVVWAGGDVGDIPCYVWLADFVDEEVGCFFDGADSTQLHHLL